MNGLPPNPGSCRLLTDEEFDYLRHLDKNLWQSPSKTCIICRKQGPIKVRLGGEIVEVECPCKEQWKLHLWLSYAGVGLHYQKLTWDDASGVKNDVKSEILRWLLGVDVNLSIGQGLTLWSPDRGTGKTLLANLVTKHLMSQGHRCCFIIFSDMLDKAQDGWRDKEARNWFESNIRNAPVLVMDDIGRENQARVQLVESMLDPIIRWRVANERPTIITTNIDPGGMKNRYGGNIFSLLTEVNHSIEVSGADFRVRARERAAEEIREGVTRPIVVGA